MDGNMYAKALEAILRIYADKLFQQVGDIKPKSQSEHDDIGNFMNLITYAHTILEARKEQSE